MVKQWYELYTVIDGTEYRLGCSQSYRSIRKDSKELNCRVRKIPTPKTVVR